MINSSIPNLRVYVGKRDLLFKTFLTLVTSYSQHDATAYSGFSSDNPFHKLIGMFKNRNPSFLIIDGLFAYGHPKEQEQQMKLLRDYLIANPNKHLFATANSPFLVNKIAPQELICVSKKGMNTISNHPEFDTWKDVMETGELWSSFGEEWIK